MTDRSPDSMPLADVLAETATCYETAVTLGPVEQVPSARARAVAQSAPPPGVLEVLEDDEQHRAVTALDDWAGFVAHVLTDEVDGLGSVPATTPGRLRLASRWAEHLEDHDDVMLRYAIGLEAREHLVIFRRLSRRGTRTVPTRSACMDVACRGTYVATIAGPGTTDELVCDRCGQRVPPEQWQRWGSRTAWITPEHAARLLGCSVQAVWQRASRGAWRRTGERRDTRYHRDDVMGEVRAIVSGIGFSADPEKAPSSTCSGA